MKIRLDHQGAPRSGSPATDDGALGLADARCLARYRCAAQVAAGRDVLDTGDRTGTGSSLLSAAGTQTVVVLEEGELSRLPYDDASFDLITCFELIDRCESPAALLDELTRVLRHAGLLFVACSHSGGELRDALAARLTNVRLVHEAQYSAAIVLGGADPAPDAGADPALDAGAAVDAIRLEDLDSTISAGDGGSFAMASDGPLPALASAAVLTGAGEPAEVARLLVDAEQQLAEIPTLKLQIADLERELVHAHRANELVSKQLAELDGRLMQNQRTLVSVMSSPSWKLTKPLRVGKRLLRG